MSSAQQRLTAWKRGAPPCAAAALACVGALELARSSWALYRLGNSSAAVAAQPGISNGQSVDLPHLLNAHLFGDAPAAASNPSAIVELRSAGDFNLTGIISMPDPSDGYAMLGRRSEATRLYRVGMTVQGLANGRLYQVFADHVVLEISGLFQILKFPAAKLPGGRAHALARVADNEQQADGAAAVMETKLQPVSVAQTLVADLEAEQNNVDGHAAGMLLHPSRAYQRRYGVHEGDVLTSVNGVAVTDAESFATLLKDSTVQSLTLTFTRDGQPHTVGMATSN